MRSASFTAFVVLVTAGCATNGVGWDPQPADRSGNVVVISSNDRPEAPRQIPRGLTRVPPGHYPPPGQCRIWRLGVPPGQQSPPMSCNNLRGPVPAGAFLLYGGRPWDTEYDWVRHEVRSPGSVPDAVVQVMSSIRIR